MKSAAGERNQCFNANLKADPIHSVDQGLPTQYYRCMPEILRKISWIPLYFRFFFSNYSIYFQLNAIFSPADAL